MRKNFFHKTFSRMWVHIASIGEGKNVFFMYTEFFRGIQ